MKRIVFSVIASIICIAVYAQDGARKPLTFKEAVKLGLQHNVTPYSTKKPAGIHTGEQNSDASSDGTKR